MVHSGDEPAESDAEVHRHGLLAVHAADAAVRVAVHARRMHRRQRVCPQSHALVLFSPPPPSVTRRTRSAVQLQVQYSTWKTCADGDERNGHELLGDAGTASEQVAHVDDQRTQAREQRDGRQQRRPRAEIH